MILYMLEQSLFDNIGFYGPLILIFVNVYSMWKKYTYCVFYFVFIFLNEGLNRILKTIFKQPRPVGYGDKIEMRTTYSGAHLYGMPSGHAQSVFFSLIYSWLVLESPYLFIFELFISFITLYQRLKYRRHTLEQLVFGGIIGMSFGYGSYYFVKNLWISQGKPFL